MPEKKPERKAGPSLPFPGGGYAADRSLVALGIGVAATAAGAALGLAAERFAVSRRLRPPGTDEATDDGRGGPPLGALRGEARIVLSGEVPLHVEVDEPDPPHHKGDLTIVMSHGYALTLDAWHYQRLHLRGRFRLVLWDQRGHGRSGTGPEGSSTIDQVGDDLAAVIESTAPKGPLLLLGHSMGGMTVMSLAAQHPEWFAERVVGVGLFSTSAGGETGVDLAFGGIVGRLGLRIAPTAARALTGHPRLVARGRAIGSDLEGLLVKRYSFASPVPPQLVQFAARMIGHTRFEVISDFLPTFGSHDKREALAAMSANEVLVMVGDEDVLTPPDASEQIVHRLPAAEHVVVRHSGHLLPLEHPDVTNEHLDELITRAQVVAAAGKRSWRQAFGRRRPVSRTVTPVRARPRRSSS
jgi:pimeloyl-ACP methyl ester carboxylesterase